MKGIKILSAIALFTMTCGCAAFIAAVAGAGLGVATYAYLTGDLKIEYPFPLNTVWGATMEALKELQIKYVSPCVCCR